MITSQTDPTKPPPKTKTYTSPINPYGPGPNAPINPIGGVVNPYSTNIEPPQDHAQDDSFGTYVGNLFGYLKDSFNQADDAFRDPSTALSLKESATNLVNTGQGIGGAIRDRVFKDAQMASDYWTKTPATQIASDINQYAHTGKDDYNLLKQKAGINTPEDQSSVPAQFGKSMLQMFAQNPIEALTGKKNDQGKAVPMTPEEQAQSVLDVAGTLAFSAVTGGMSSSITKAGIMGAGETSARALGRTTVLGKMGKIIAAEIPAAAAGGATQGFISGIGDESQFAHMVSGALTTLPLAFIMAPFKYKGVNQAIKGAVQDFNVMQLKDAGELAASKSLQITAESTPAEILANIDSFTKADDLLEAAVTSNLKMGNGYLVENISPEKIGQMFKTSNTYDGVQPAPAIVDTKLEKANPTYHGQQIEWGSSFDKLAYMLSSKSAPKTNKNFDYYMTLALGNTKGLDEQAIINHGLAVRKSLLDNINKLTPRNQYELDAANLDAINKGKSIVESGAAQAQDIEGKIWTRNNDTYNSGPLTYPIDSQELHSILGTDNANIKSRSPYIRMDQVPFQPLFGKDAPAEIFTYPSANGSVFVSPVKLKDQYINNFKTTGFFEKELVSVAGKDGIILNNSDPNKMSVQILGEQSPTEINASDIMRKPNFSGNHIFEKAGEQTVGIPAQLDKPTYFDQLYGKFKDTFKMDDPNQLESFDSIFQRFLKDNKVNLDDTNQVKTLFYKNLQNEAIEALPKSEQAHINNAKTILEDTYNSSMADKYSNVYNNAIYSGSYFENAGSGRYHLRDSATGKVITTVNDPLDAQSFITNSRSSQGLSLDGGGTGQVDPAIASYEKMTPTDYTPNRFWLTNKFDNLKTSSLGSFITPIRDQLNALDNNTTKDGSSAIVHSAMQDAMNRRRAFIEGPLAPAIRQFAQMNQVLDKLPEASKLRVTNYMETRSPADLAKLLNPAEQQLAQGLAKAFTSSGVDPAQVKDYLYQKKGLTDTQPAATIDAFKAQTDPKVMQLGSAIEAMIQGASEDVAPHKVLKMMEALVDPTSHLSQAEYALKYGITAAEQKVSTLARSAFDAAFKATGQSADDYITWYVPNMRVLDFIPDSRWAKVNPQSTEFLRELTRLGITPDALKNRDINDLAYSYLQSASKVKSGYAKIMSDANKFVFDDKTGLIQRIRSADPNAAAGAKGLYEKYFTTVNSGGADYNTQLDKFVKTLGSSDKGFGFGVPTTGSVMQFFMTMYMGAKSALGLRHIAGINILSNAAFGSEFTKDAFWRKPVSDEYIQQLDKEGRIPPTDSSIILKQDVTPLQNPAEKISSAAMTSTLLPWVYRKSIGGIYQASIDQFQRVSSDLEQGRISRADFAKELGLSTFSDAIQRGFMTLVENGKNEQAAHFLAQNKASFLASTFGNYNNPLSWSGKWGRAFGQMGSWLANTTSSTMDIISRGTPAEALQRTMRGTAGNAIVYGALTAAGFDAAKWIIAPGLQIPGVGPILQNYTNIKENADNLFSSDEHRQAYAMHNIKRALGSIYTPQVLTDIMDANKMYEQGSYDLLQIAGRSIGMPVIRDPHAPH